MFTMERDIITGEVEKTRFGKHVEPVAIDKEAKIREYVALGAIKLVRAINIVLPADYEHVASYEHTHALLLELLEEEEMEEAGAEAEKEEEEEEEEEDYNGFYEGDFTGDWDVYDE